jgi:hypothetical protein
MYLDEYERQFVASRIQAKCLARNMDRAFEILA